MKSIILCEMFAFWFKIPKKDKTKLKHSTCFEVKCQFSFIWTNLK